MNFYGEEGKKNKTERKRERGITKIYVWSIFDVPQISPLLSREDISFNRYFIRTGIHAHSANTISA